MSFAEKIAAERRPAYEPGTKQAVIAKSTPVGFSQPVCFFCQGVVLNPDFTMHHEVSWCEIEEVFDHDYDVMIATPEEREEARRYVFSYIENLHAAHKPCNSAEGHVLRDRQAWRRHEERRKSEPERWRY